MWPVVGKFGSEQRELVQFVLDDRNCILARVRPDLTPLAIRDEAKVAMGDLLKRTRFSKPIDEQAARRLVETGGGLFSQPVGMTVHDDGDHSGGTLRPGHEDWLQNLLISGSLAGYRSPPPQNP